MNMTESEKADWWDEICDGVKDGVVDAYPIFNVKDPYFKFNITGSVTFEGIVFDGTEAAQRYETKHYPPINQIPFPLCHSAQIADPLKQFNDRLDCLKNGKLACHKDLTESGVTGNILEFTQTEYNNTTVNRNFIYTSDVMCDAGLADVRQRKYDGVNPSICLSVADETAMGSVRACGVEPYNDEFFEID